MPQEARRDDVPLLPGDARRATQHPRPGQCITPGNDWQLGMNGLTDPALKAALDLCLECKACKSECPTNVDMARLKAEFLHQYYEKNGLPWRNWLFGNVAEVSWWASGWPGLCNWLAKNRYMRWLN